MNKSGKIHIRYKFKGDPEIQDDWLTQKQYERIRELPVIEFCEVIDGSNTPKDEDSSKKKA